MIAMAMTSTVRPSSTGSMMSMAMSAPTKVTVPPIGLDEALGEHGAQHRGVAADARDEVAGAARVELGDGQAQHLRDEALAAREHHTLAGALQQVVLVARDDAADDHEGDEAPDDPAERLAGLDDRDHLADEQRLGEARDGADDREHADPDEHGAVLEDERQQLPEGRARPGRRRAAPADGAASGGGGGLRGAHLLFLVCEGERMPHPPMPRRRRLAAYVAYLRPYFLCTACFDTSRARAMSCQLDPRPGHGARRRPRRGRARGSPRRGRGAARGGPGRGRRRRRRRWRCEGCGRPCRQP